MYGPPRNQIAVGNPYGFTGRRHDPETGLMYYRNRYYSPEIGRFLTYDPIGIWGDPMGWGNGYGYCRDNSVFLVDPLGLDPVKGVGVLLFAAGIVVGAFALSTADEKRGISAAGGAV